MFIDFQPIDVTVQNLDRIRLPRMVRIRQIYDKARIADIPAHVAQRLAAGVAQPERFSGKRIAITAGSRGIPHYVEILKTIVDTLKGWGAIPFVVPAMGSHAGATAEGQRAMLEGFGITEESVGCPILSSMEVVQIAALSDGSPLYCDKNAYGADGIVVFNKVKAHTCFKAEHESGLLKMMVIGLGKHVGAASMHAMGYGVFPSHLLEGGQLFIQNAPVVLGVGLVQNAQDDISDIEVYPPEKIVEGDAELLRISKEKMPQFKFPATDVLIIDRIGKNISGSGFDPNVVCRKDRAFPNALQNQMIFCRGLTEETHHNATGLSSCDITTLRVVRDVDWGATWTNIMTAVPASYCSIPCYAANDRQALLWSVKSCLGLGPDGVRIVRILDTNHLEEIQVSENLARALSVRDDIEILSEPFEMDFDSEGNLVD